MTALPKNVRIGRSGRIGILKKVPRDLWIHPNFCDKAKVIERSTGLSDPEVGIPAALAMLATLENEFAMARFELSQIAQTEKKQAELFRLQPVVRPPRVKKEQDVSKSRTQIGEETRRDILSVAMQEFAEKGLRGARVDDIAAKTRTTKPMIYYHFGSKEKLYAAVMEEAYGLVREREQNLHLDDLPPKQAMQKLVEVSFDHHAAHPEYVRLISVENIERGRHITGRPSLVKRNAIAIETVRKLLERGEREGVFRAGINPWHLHFMISSFCFMRVSNRYTWRAVFEMDVWDTQNSEEQRKMIVEAVLRYVIPS